MTIAATNLRLAQRPGILRLRRPGSSVGKCLPSRFSNASSTCRAAPRRQAGKVNASQKQEADLESTLSLENFLLTTSFLALADPAFAEEEAQVATEAVSETVAQVADTVTQVADTVPADAVAVDAAVVSDTVNQVVDSIPEEAVSPLVKYAVYSIPTLLYLLWTVFRTVNREAKLLDFVNLVVGIVVVGNIVSIVFFKVRWF